MAIRRTSATGAARPPLAAHSNAQFAIFRQGCRSAIAGSADGPQVSITGVVVQTGLETAHGLTGQTGGDTGRDNELVSMATATRQLLGYVCLIGGTLPFQPTSTHAPFVGSMIRLTRFSMCRHVSIFLG